MTKPLKAAVCGICGYGQFFLRYFLEQKPESAKLVAVIDPASQKCPMIEQIRQENIPEYDSVSSFFKSSTADLLIIASPHQLHAPQTIEALKNGCNVLCEKPLCPTIQEAYDMIAARQQAQKMVAVGYQWGYSKAFRELKSDILSGVFGAPVRLKAMAFWPRAKSYFTRNSWAGAMKDERGAWVLDSPVMNATAHFLHAMLYALGKAPESSAMPVDIEAELYRANDISSFDTAMLRINTDAGAEVLYYTTHACRENHGPHFDFEFEKARVKFDFMHDICATLNDGTTKSYGIADHGSYEKIEQTIDALLKNEPPSCGIEASVCQVLCANGAHESAPEIVNFPAGLTREESFEEKETVYVEGLDEIIAQSFSMNALPSETGVEWAKKGKRIDLRGYKKFPHQL